MKRETRTRTEIANILLRHIQRIPGSEHIKGIRIQPHTDAAALPSVAIDVDAGARHQADTAIRAIRRMVPVLYQLYDVRNFTVH